MESIAITVKRQKERIDLMFEDREAVLVEAVFEEISERTGVIKRSIKLISQGKQCTMNDCKKRFIDCFKVKSAKVVVMMIDSDFTATNSNSSGQMALTEKRRTEAKEAMMIMKKSTDDLNNGDLSKKMKMKNNDDSSRSSTMMKMREKNWLLTGIVSQQNSQLENLPDLTALNNHDEESLSLFKVKVFDFDSNYVSKIPESLYTNTMMLNVTRISLSNNRIESVDFKAMFKNFKFLKHLDLSANKLRGELDIVGSDDDDDEKQSHAKSSTTTTTNVLLNLNLSKNYEITGITEQFFKKCPPLQILECESNQIKKIVDFAEHHNETITHISFAGNKRIKEIPESFANLRNLQSLVLDSNMISKTGIPQRVLDNCERLSELSLKNNAVTVEELRELDGWQKYNERRVSRADKILESKTILGEASFREGADAERYMRDF